MAYRAMSIAPEVLDALLASGATAEMIVAAVKADAAIDEAKVAERRAKDADRQRRYRLSRDVTVTACDSAETVSPQSPPLKVPPDPLKITPPLTPHPQQNCARGSRLPEGWEPKPLTAKTAEMVAAWPAGMIERELAKFKDHWLKTPGAKGRSLDWDASYRNWLRNADERRPRNFANERSDRDPTTVALELLASR